METFISNVKYAITNTTAGRQDLEKYRQRLDEVYLYSSDPNWVHDSLVEWFNDPEFVCPIMMTKPDNILTLCEQNQIRANEYILKHVILSRDGDMYKRFEHIFPENFNIFTFILQPSSLSWLTPTALRWMINKHNVQPSQLSGLHIFTTLVDNNKSELLSELYDKFSSIDPGLYTDGYMNTVLYICNSNYLPLLENLLDVYSVFFSTNPIVINGITMQSYADIYAHYNS